MSRTTSKRGYSDKSYVSMEQHICLVCGQAYDTGAILLDRRLRDSMERYTLTGNGLCPEHQKLHDDGYIALIEIDPTKTTIHGNNIKPGEEYRTGKVCHLKREAAGQIFNVPITDKPLMFVEPGVIEKLQAMVEGGEESGIEDN